MNSYQLYRLISKNQKLAMKRHPMFESNKAMKVFGYIFAGFWAVYLIVFGVVFGNALGEESREAYDILNGGFIIFLAIDFFTRFGMQETPAQEIKPYKLLPVKVNFLLNTFLARIGLSGYNLFWFFFFVPFTIIARQIHARWSCPPETSPISFPDTSVMPSLCISSRQRFILFS